MTADRQIGGGDDAPLRTARDEKVRAEEDSDRGKRATFDRRTGEVSGSGSGIGNPASSEDYDADLSVGSGSARKTGGPSNSA